MLRSKKETNLQTSGLARENQWAQWVQFVDILPVCSPHLEPWVFSGPHVGHQNVVLKQTVECVSSKDGFLWNQQRIAIWVLQSWWAMCKSHVETKGELFYWGEKEFGRARVHGFSLTESLPGKKGLSSCYRALLWP